MDDGPLISASSETPPRRFDFVHNPELRPIVEQAYTEGRRALAQGDYSLALLTSCGILEAIVIYALEHKGLTALAAPDTPAGKIADWSFETRLAVAERTGLIRSGCALLPAVARTYRDLTNADGESGPKSTVSERDARGCAGASCRDEGSECRSLETGFTRPSARPSHPKIADVLMYRQSSKSWRNTGCDGSRLPSITPISNSS